MRGWHSDGFELLDDDTVEVREHDCQVLVVLLGGELEGCVEDVLQLADGVFFERREGGSLGLEAHTSGKLTYILIASGSISDLSTVRESEERREGLKHS